MIPAHRRARIVEIIRKNGQVVVADLAALFRVSEETVRRDLRVLEKQGVLQRNYGGAILAEDSPGVPPLEERQMVHRAEKERIGAAAVGLLGSARVVLLDAGSTTLQVARQLRDRRGLTVVTNDLGIADELRGAEGVDVLVTGGQLKRHSRSLVGPDTVAAIRRYHVDVAFLGTSGLTLGRGLTTSDVLEAEVKSAMIAAAGRVVVVSDSSKFGKNNLVAFARIADVHVLVTDAGIPPDAAEALRRAGVEVIVVQVPTDAQPGQ